MKRKVIVSAHQSKSKTPEKNPSSKGETAEESTEASVKHSDASVNVNTGSLSVKMKQFLSFLFSSILVVLGWVIFRSFLKSSD